MEEQEDAILSTDFLWVATVFNYFLSLFIYYNLWHTKIEAKG